MVRWPGQGMLREEGAIRDRRTASSPGAASGLDGGRPLHRSEGADARLKVGQGDGGGWLRGVRGGVVRKNHSHSIVPGGLEVMS
jgi:hypothetical protein